VPHHYKDATSVAIESGQVTCVPYSGPYTGFAEAPFPSSLFGTPRTMFNPRQLQFSAKFTF
jgi:hypothetical protein